MTDRVQTEYDEKYEKTRTNYVRNEICVVVETTNIPSPQELYDNVRQYVNQRILAWLREPVPSDDDCRKADELSFVHEVQRDLQPTLLRPRATNAVELLRPLNRRNDAKVNPWVLLPRPGQPTRGLCYYEIDSLGPAADLAFVRQLVNLINLRVLSRDQSIASPAFTILAATPNWSVIIAGNSGCTGPGSAPAPVPREDEPGRGASPVSFDFGRCPRLAEMEKERRRQIEEALAGRLPAESSCAVVAIVDTSPTRERVARAVGEHPDNWLLKYVFDTVAIDPPGAFSPQYFNFLNEYFPNWGGPEETFPDGNPDHYQMADHGLFIAGIVRALAPTVKICLIRAVGDNGVCDMHAVSLVLRQLPASLDSLFGPDANRRIVVNLSLGADLPVGTRFPLRWFSQTYDQIGDPAARETFLDRIAKQVMPDQFTGDHAKARFGDLTQWGLWETIDWLTQQGVLVVAAVGNDRFIPPFATRKDPRYPAHYDPVLGVTATKLRLAGSVVELADYANRGDESQPVEANGVATYGGNADPPAGPRSGPPRIDLTAHPVDAIKGIFSANPLPLAGGPNATGWVYWAGTSFATPIISAIAANLWGRACEITNPAEISRRVIELDAKFSSQRVATANAPNVPCIEAKPALRVAEEHLRRTSTRSAKERPDGGRAGTATGDRPDEIRERRRG
jgi:hypothetical protein